jgi:hypothetical protein
MTHNPKLRKLGVVDASKNHMNIWKEMNHYWLMTLGVLLRMSWCFKRRLVMLSHDFGCLEHL